MSEVVEHDPVNHPKHYRNASGIECIDVVETKSFNVGNAIKYLWRAGEKDDTVQDLRKAQWYIAREIERLERETLRTYASPEQAETPPERRSARIKITRWEYNAEIDRNGVAHYRNAAGEAVQAAPDHYKVIGELR